MPLQELIPSLCIRRLASRGGERLTDAELVDRFTDHQDAAAFEVLVWRHGPMVWATCRRILRQLHDAEDAFQAAFFALARRAGSIGRRQAVGGWLHRVASNAALKLRAKRLSTELPADIAARTEHHDEELAVAVDEELDRLPEAMRAAFVLCGLEGMTNTEAARELGCPVGTVDSRLHAARSRLKVRLARRGFAPSVLAGLVIAHAPSNLIASTIDLGSSTPSRAIAELAMHASRATSIRSTCMKVGITSLLALAGALFVLASLDQGTLPTTIAAPVPLEVQNDPGRIVLWREGHPIALAPDAKTRTPLASAFEDKRGMVKVGPDGTHLVYLHNRMTLRPANPDKQDKIHLWDGKQSKEIPSSVPCFAFWGADGLVYGHGFEPPKWGDPEPPVDLRTDFVNWSFNPRTGFIKSLKLPGDISILDRAPDGKSFLAFRYEMPPNLAASSPGVWAEQRLGLLSLDGKEFTPLTKLAEAASEPRFSPDGRFVLDRVHRIEKGDRVPVLTLFDLKNNKRREVAVPKDARVGAACWSPDGNRIAFVWESQAESARRSKDFGGPVRPGQKDNPKYTVTVSRPDGTEAKDIYTDSEFIFGSIDWASAAPRMVQEKLPEPQLAKPDEIAPNGEITGRLIDDATGKPVEGATIACGAIYNESGQGGGANAVTDAQGRYRMRVPSPGLYNVWLKKHDADAGKTAAADDGVLVEAGKLATSELRLSAGRKVTGKATDANGKPMAGLTVSCHSMARPQSGGPQSTKTADDGTFSFSLPPGLASFYAIESVEKTEDNPFGAGRSASEQYRIPPTGELAPVALKMRLVFNRFGDDAWLKLSTPGTKIEGQVKDEAVIGTVVGTDGKPLSGVKLMRDGESMIAANEKGEFRVEIAKGTQFILHAWAPGHHVWYGTPTTGNVLKIALERKEKRPVVGR